jgi:hypothetical protein
MDETKQMTAWNNMVMNADPTAYQKGDERRAASIACLYMGGANNGGLNAFLTNYYDLDAEEVLQSLDILGANSAADQLRSVLEALGTPLPAATQEERWDQLEQLWTDEFNACDFLNEDADKSLVIALEAHVSKHIQYYESMAS